MHFVQQDAPDIVKVDGFDFDVGKESGLIEQHCTSSIMGHVEPIRDKLVVNILNRLLCKVMMCHLPAICFLLFHVGVLGSSSR